MDSQKTRLALVLSSNFILSLLIGYGIWTGVDTQKAVELAANKTAAKTDLPDLKSKQVPGKTEKTGDLAEQKQDAAASPSSPAGRKDASATNQQYKRSHFVPPPPPIDSYSEGPRAASAPIASRPAPSKGILEPQGKLAGVKLSGVIGNKAILLMRREGASRNERLEAVCLAPGESVTTINKVPISILEVEPSKVVMNVGGNRLVRLLPEIR